MITFTDILNKEALDKQDLITLLSAKGSDQELLFQKAREVADQYIGRKVYLRGLIEYSNVCGKDCCYCGIRKSNKNQKRYILSDDEVIACAQFAFEQNYGSVVIQSGERCDEIFTSKITALIKEIKKLSNGKLGITLSLGEQSLETYQEWYDAGAHRYLLRIESSNRELYYKIHPYNTDHLFENRLIALQNLRKAGFQVGTGVMIGLPEQTIEDLANDLLFMKSQDIDMVGMGPYIEHMDTPMFESKNLLLPKTDRLNLAFNMIAVLRILIKDINIAASTALQAIDPKGREKALQMGANIIMPNITPNQLRKNYKLYEDKPCLDETPLETTENLKSKIQNIGFEIGFNQWGDSKHFLNKDLQALTEYIQV